MVHACVDFGTVGIYHMQALLMYGSSVVPEGKDAAGNELLVIETWLSVLPSISTS